MTGGPPHSRWDGRERPRWWPEGEPFPPADWHRMRGRFVRRAIGFVVMFIVFFAFVVALFVSLIIGIFGSATSAGLSGALVPLLALFLLVVSFSAARGIRRLIVPLGDLIDAAETVEGGDYSVRVRARGPRELRALAGAFNAMSSRLERSEAERRRLLADVTHELRTPLTVMQGNVEALIDGVHPTDAAHLGAVLEETRVLSRLVDDLRTLSLAEAGALALHREATDATALARDTVASFDVSARSAGVELRVDAAGPLEAHVDAVRVREVLTNVLANALRHTPRGGSVSVSVSPADGAVAMSVRDTGAGIAPDVLPHVFERFTRGPDSPGAGLGLAIAKSLVTAHGGDIVATSVPGQGTEIRFTLPREPATT